LLTSDNTSIAESDAWAGQRGFKHDH